MKRASTVVLLLTATALAASAQKKFYMQQHPVWEEWQTNPYVRPVEPAYAAQPAIIVLSDVAVDYRREGGKLAKHTADHQVVKVLQASGIKRYSTIEVPVAKGAQVAEVRARIVTAKGGIRLIDHKQISVVRNDDGSGKVKIKVDGLEPNNEIEYLVKQVQLGGYFGLQYMQGEEVVAHSRFRISYPKDLVVETKSYAGFAAMTTTIEGNRKVHKVEVKDIDALQMEPMTYYNRYRAAIAYKVSYVENTNRGREQLNTYQMLANRMYADNYGYTKAELRAVNSFLTELGVKPNGNEVQNVRKIEHGIKTLVKLLPEPVQNEQKNEVRAAGQQSMSVYAVGYKEAEHQLEDVLRTRRASRKAYMRLYAACLSQAGVAHEVGMAWDPAQQVIDAAFESWLGLDYALIYLPKQQKYMSPYSAQLRYPLVPLEVMTGKGVFCSVPKRAPIAGVNYSIRKIATLTAADNRHDISAKLTLDKAMNAGLNMVHEWYGYEQVAQRGQLTQQEEGSVKKYAIGQTGLDGAANEINECAYSNNSPEAVYTGKPLSLYVTASVPGLVTKDKKTYKVRIGALIVKQQTLPGAEGRVLPLDIRYPSSKKHTITLQLPKGYKVLNPNVVNVTADYVNGELDELISFKAGYKLVKDAKNGDRMVIEVKERYDQLHYPLYEYDRFAKVYNAASAFSKVELVVGKK